MRQVAGGRRMWLAVLLTALLAAGCSANPAADAEMRAVMSALGPTPMVVGLERRERWLLRGGPEPGQLSVALDEGLPAVLAVAGSGEYSAGHWVNLHLLAVPYLTWRWKMASHPGPFHPVRLAVGFADTGGADGKMPEARRELELVWSDKALKRGVMDEATAGRPATSSAAGRKPSAASGRKESTWSPCTTAPGPASRPAGRASSSSSYAPPPMTARRRRRRH